jgi:hypothetical protein
VSVDAEAAGVAEGGVEGTLAVDAAEAEPEGAAGGSAWVGSASAPLAQAAAAAKKTKETTRR